MTYALFVTSAFIEPGAAGSTGGTISNYQLFSEIAKAIPVVILEISAEKREIGQVPPSVEILRVDAPKWRGLSAFSNWVPFVVAETGKVVDARGLPRWAFATTSTLSALSASAFRRVPKVAIVQAFENFGFDAPSLNWQTRISLVKRALRQRFSDGDVMRSADVIVSNSVFMSEMVSRRFQVGLERIQLIPQLCDLGAMDGVFAEPRSVGFVNRTADKNFGFVVDLARRMPKWKFLIYGYPPSKTDALPDNVTLQGWRRDRERLFTEAAVWIVPSRWPEPFGRVSIEAQAANRPVVVAAVGGLPETVEDDRFIVSGFDVDTWAERIEALSSLSPATLSDIGLRTRQKFSAEAHARAIGALLSRVGHATAGGVE